MQLFLNCMNIYHHYLKHCLRQLIRIRLPFQIHPILLNNISYNTNSEQQSDKMILQWYFCSSFVIYSLAIIMHSIASLTSLYYN